MDITYHDLADDRYDKIVQEYIEYVDKGIPQSDTPKKNVLIIGAGISGLVAGSMLKQAGHQIQIIEASKRVGGRIKTFRDEFSGSLYAEAGAMRLPDRHLTKLVLDRTKVGNRLTELMAIRRVLSRLTDGRLSSANRRGTELQPTVVEHVECHFVTFANFTEQVVRRDVYILKEYRCGRGPMQSHLVFFLTARDAIERPFDNKSREVLTVDFGKDDIEVGKPTVRDPHLLAGQGEATVVLPNGTGFRAERV